MNRVSLVALAMARPFMTMALAIALPARRIIKPLVPFLAILGPRYYP